MQHTALLRCTLALALAPALPLPLAAAQAPPGRFNTEPEPGHSVTLEALLAHAEGHAPVLALAQARLKYAGAARAEAAPLWTEQPQLELELGPRIASGVDTGVDVRASLEQAIEIAGARGQRFAAARSLDARLHAEQAAVRAELRRELTLAYRLAAIARAKTELLTQTAQFADSLLAIARRRFAAGDIGIIDVRLTEADAALAREALLAGELELQSARLRLCELSGWPAQDPPLPQLELAPADNPPPLEPLLRATNTESPELRALRAARSEARARAELAEREAVPTPVLGVHYERESVAGGADNHIVLGSLSVALPFWARNPGARARAWADRDVAVVELQAAALAREITARRAHAVLTTAAQRVAVLRAAVAPKLAESLALLQRAFDAGEIALLDLSAARERLLSVEQDELAAYADYEHAHAELEAALGIELAAQTSQLGGVP